MWVAKACKKNDENCEIDWNNEGDNGYKCGKNASENFMHTDRYRNKMHYDQIIVHNHRREDDMSKKI